MVPRFSSRRLSALLLCFFSAISRPANAAADPTWMRISSAHFSLVTDASEKRGRDALVRFEQMRLLFAQLLARNKVNISHPIEILLLRTPSEYSQVAPIRNGQPLEAPGFFLPGKDRDYFVLNSFDDQSWRAISHDFAHYLLNYNYPSTQAWFDEGFAEYFSSVHLNDRTVELGGDPELVPGMKENVFGDLAKNYDAPKSFTELLDTPVWLALPDLFQLHNDAFSYSEGSHHSLFYAESWIVMHYLIRKNKLADAGTYFELVQNQHLPIEKAILRAYDMSPAQLTQSVRDYFNALTPLFTSQDKAKLSTQTPLVDPVDEFPSPIDVGNIATSSQPVPVSVAQALLAEMSVRIPEHRQQSLQQLEALINQPKTENGIAHRALGWASMEKKDYAVARAEFERAIELEVGDPWARYEMSLLKYQVAQSTGKSFQGLANLLQDMRKVIDWDPEFADAYNLLALARLDGGGAHYALEAMKTALQLAPRDQSFLFNMAQIQIASKQWDAATAILEMLKTSPNMKVARLARQTLDDLPTLKKYGILPQSDANPQTAVMSQGSDDPGSEAPEPARPPSVVLPDKREVRFVKGKLVGVDCSSPPAAILTVQSQGKILRLRTEDSAQLTLIGADKFSCSWTSRPLAVNYKTGGKSDGDLVSIEFPYSR